MAAALVAQMPPPASDGRTVEAAQSYISTVLIRGTTKIVLYPQSGGEEKVTIQTATPSACVTTLGYGGLSRVIDWGLVSQVNHSGANLFISGSIKTENGVIVDHVYLETESYEFAQRVSKAMTFLREQCDQTKGNPFG